MSEENKTPSKAPAPIIPLSGKGGALSRLATGKEAELERMGVHAKGALVASLRTIIRH